MEDFKNVTCITCRLSTVCREVKAAGGSSASIKEYIDPVTSIYDEDEDEEDVDGDED